MGLLVVLSLAACRPFGGSGGFVGTSQECAFWLQGSPPEPITILFVVDNSAAAGLLQTRIAGEIARIVDEQLAFDPAHGRDAWYHFGAISADPAEGARLRGGCGLTDDRPFVDYRRDAFSNVEPALGRLRSGDSNPWNASRGRRLRRRGSQLLRGQSRSP